jgi:ABC-type transport system substrate-binding protein/tRNA A-37 threonylcarbamoyl transferase component Bud32
MGSVLDEHIGQQWGDYRLTRLIGQGSFAHVYLGEQLQQHTRAVIKILHTRLATQEEIERFGEETRTVAALAHPSILRLLGADVEGDTPYLVLDEAPGGSLRQRLPTGTPLPLSTILPPLKQLAEALEYLHQRGLPHGHLTPQQILLGRGNEVLLSDIRLPVLAQRPDAQHALEASGAGTYLAPEQFQGQPQPASDLYALGVIVYEWLTGAPPFQGSFAELADQHWQAPPPPLRSKLPDLPESVEQVVLRALAKDPRQRFGSARAFVEALERAAQVRPAPVGAEARQGTLEMRGSAGSGAVQPRSGSLNSRLPGPPKAPASAPPPPAGRALLLIGALLLVLIVGSGGVAFWLRSGALAGANTAQQTPTPSAQALIYHYHAPTHQGGTVTLADWHFPNSTNPWFAVSQTDTTLADALYAQPLLATSDGTLLPDELKELPTQANGEVSKDGLTVTMRLKPGLKWSDGQPLTSADVLYWWQVDQDPASGAANTVGYDQIAGITTPDAATVVLRYKHPFAAFLSYLPLAAPKHAWGSIPNGQLATTPEVNLAPKVTSGPYEVQSAADGQSITMTPNPNYRSTSLYGPVLATLVFKNYQSKDALIAAYQAGEIDHAEGFSLDDLAKLSGVQALRLAPSLVYEQLAFNLHTPALQDLNTRKAIEQAIDRCALIQSALHQSCGTLLENQVEPCPQPGCDASIKPAAFDLNAAKADMQKAGWACSANPCTKGGQPFPTLALVTSADDPLLQAVSQSIQHDLAALGVPVSLEPVPAFQLLGDFASGGILATGAYDLALFANYALLDADSTLFSAFQSGQIPSAQAPFAGNYQRIADPQIDNLLAQGRSTLDQSQRASIYRRLGRYIIAQSYLLPLYLLPNISLSSPRIGNYFDNPTLWGNAWNCGEWYVNQ